VASVSKRHLRGVWITVTELDRTSTRETPAGTEAITKVSVGSVDGEGDGGLNCRLPLDRPAAVGGITVSVASIVIEL
jgi:hypothetical protein